MNNPFLQDGYLTPYASINKIKIPEKNLYAIDMVSSEVFQKDGIRAIGHNLAYLLCSLKKKNLIAREGWTEEHWRHWRQTEKIFLAGGITAEPLGSELLGHIHTAFESMGDIPYKIAIPKDSHVLSLLGAAKLAACDNSYKGSAFVFDFGQSYIKRGYVKELTKKTQVLVMEKKESRYVDLDYENDSRSKGEAERLDSFVQEVIKDTCRESFSLHKPQELLIILSIANYVYKGAISGSRGGYGKLCLICNNYEKYLKERLAAEFKIPLRVILVHDGMAAAAMLNEENEAYAVITLGTYMGVGFPSSCRKLSSFDYELVYKDV